MFELAGTQAENQALHPRVRTWHACIHQEHTQAPFGAHTEPTDQMITCTHTSGELGGRRRGENGGKRSMRSRRGVSKHVVTFTHPLPFLESSTAQFGREPVDAQHLPDSLGSSATNALSN